MFIVIPLVEFLHVLGVDINVHHENPATFLCHVSVSSVKRSRHRFASSRWHPVLNAWSPGETRDTNWGAILANGATRNIMGRKCPWPFPQPEYPQADFDGRSARGSSRGQPKSAEQL